MFAIWCPSDQTYEVCISGATGSGAVINTPDGEPVTLTRDGTTNNFEYIRLIAGVNAAKYRLECLESPTAFSAANSGTLNLYYWNGSGWTLYTAITGIDTYRSQTRPVGSIIPGLGIASPGVPVTRTVRAVETRWLPDSVGVTFAGISPLTPGCYGDYELVNVTGYNGSFTLTRQSGLFTSTGEGSDCGWSAALGSIHYRYYVGATCPSGTVAIDETTTLRASLQRIASSADGTGGNTNYNFAMQLYLFADSPSVPLNQKPILYYQAWNMATMASICGPLDLGPYANGFTSESPTGAGKHLAGYGGTVTIHAPDNTT
jgi:hypothetical protein